VLALCFARTESQAAAEPWTPEPVVVRTTAACSDSYAELIEYRAGSQIGTALQLRIFGETKDEVPVTIPFGVEMVDLGCDRLTSGKSAVSVYYLTIAEGWRKAPSSTVTVSALGRHTPGRPESRSFPQTREQFALRRGKVEAFVTELDHRYPHDSGFRVTIVRSGVVHNVTPPTDGVGLLYARLVPIDSSGEPLLLLSVDTGGNGCCGSAYAYVYDKRRDRYDLIRARFDCKQHGDARPTEDGGSVFLSSEMSGEIFGGNPARCSGPLVTLGIRNGRFVDTSLEHESFIRADARAQLKEATSPPKEYPASERPTLVLLDLAAYLGDRCKLGECADGWRTVRAYDARFRSNEVIAKMNLLFKSPRGSYDGMPWSAN
jgi:hypothetical protein